VLDGWRWSSFLDVPSLYGSPEILATYRAKFVSYMEYCLRQEIPEMLEVICYFIFSIIHIYQISTFNTLNKAYIDFPHIAIVNIKQFL